MFLVSATGHGSPTAIWEYHRSSASDSTPRHGTLAISRQRYITLKQFCLALGCRAFYQWPSHRAIIQNRDPQVGAIVSSLTHQALVDGRLYDFEGDVLSDAREGYLLPLDLAVKLAPALRLGRLEKKEAPIPEAKPAETSVPMVFKTIVIDPGHGGNDMGTGFGGINEKDIAVIYALRLRDELAAQMPDLRVILTREDDHYVSLSDRAHIANAVSASLFLSLHVNHAPSTKIDGAETYILSPDATDDDAKKLAIIENDSWLKNTKVQEAGETVRKILADMEQTKYIQNSAMAAAFIQQELAQLERAHGLKNRGVKQAMFYLLSQVAMPSALLEMGFLSNTGDRSRMMDLAFRDQFVRSVVTALKHYRDKVYGGK